ncbi:SULT1 [Mytilus edulis]|uniref:SULT1 n=1 Tax=Mytilus edulis TaxID=6550 RepID=A0A8S3T9C9_MYTED|nr:SULT1 [Mytilus edulis]
MSEANIEALLAEEPRPLLVYQDIKLPSFLPLRGDGLEKRMKEITEFNFLESDILICGYPKSGNNWSQEIIELIVNQKGELTQTIFSDLVLEFCDIDNLQNLTMARRTLHTHLPLRFLMSNKKLNKIKIVVILRNPKDVCVSFYHHSKKDVFTKHLDVPWNDFFDIWTRNELPYGSWYRHVKEFEKAKKNGLNVTFLHYEDLLTQPQSAITNLAESLKISCTNDLVTDIIKTTSFENMKQNKKELSKIFDPEGKGLIFRKGQVGDWKNWFTDAQNEIFDKQFEDEMNDSNLEFKFS